MADLLAEAKALEGELIALRRDLHSRPELSGREYATSARVLEELRKLGIDAKQTADTGVVGVLCGAYPGKCVALRADLDALPIHEETNLEFKSGNPGVMHACGHDMHAAALIGAAKLLAARRNELRGSVKFFFQPDEEENGGARRMIDEGCMENVNAVFAAHADPELPAGMVGIRSGAAYASSNPFDITVRGKSCHGAQPHLGCDAIVAASAMVGALQTVVSRRLSPMDCAVVTVGSFHSGTARNIVADEARLSGIIRCFGDEMRRRLAAEIAALAEGVAASYGVEAQVEVQWGYAGVINDEAMTACVHSSAARLLGEANITDRVFPTLTTEDFGAYQACAPGSYWHFGVGCKGKENAPLHNPLFNPDEAALKYAAALHAQTALDYLNA